MMKVLEPLVLVVLWTDTGQAVRSLKFVCILSDTWNMPDESPLRRIFIQESELMTATRSGASIIIVLFLVRNLDPIISQSFLR